MGKTLWAMRKFIRVESNNDYMSYFKVLPELHMELYIVLSL